MKHNTTSPRVTESSKRRVLGDITNVVGNKNPNVTDGKQNVTDNITTVEKDTEAALVGVADVAGAAVAEDVGVAEDTVVREIGAARPDSDLSIFSVPEKLVLSSRHDIVPPQMGLLRGDIPLHEAV